MKLEYLKEFIEATENIDLTQTAKKLDIAPSVLSKHIASLEKELGVSLFLSAKKNVLTNYGVIMLPYAKEIIELEEDFLNQYSKKSETPNTKETLKIAISPIQTREISGRIIEDFICTNPGVNIKKIETGNSNIINLVKTGKCDFGFCRLQSEYKRDDEITSIPVSISEAFVYISINNHLSNKKSLSFEDIKDETIYLRSENSSIYKVCLQEYQKLGLTPKIEFASEHIVYENLKNDKGITIYLSELINTEYSQSIKTIPISPSLTSYIDLVFKRETLSSSKALFLEFAFHSFMINLK